MMTADRGIRWSTALAVRRAAVRAGLPADVVIEVCGKVHSDGSLNPV